MLIYVIPLVIFLIALVVFKKRQDAQGSDKATAQKTKAKKASSSAKVAPNRTQAAETAPKPKTTALSDDVRSKIQNLINEHNFFSAEAQINQALKKDNTQHELYLYLLDIHILQKDEFAVSQLMNHLESLELDDILAQAKAKQAGFEQSQKNSGNASAHIPSEGAIEFTSPAGQQAPTPKPQQNTADFDALMDTAPPVQKQPESSNSFEDAVKAPAAVPAPPAPAVEEIKPLDFNLSFDHAPAKAPEPEPQPVPAAAPITLEFGLADEPAAAPAPEAKTEAPASEIKPIDFSLDLGASAPAETAKPAEEAAPLDFSFTTEAPAEAAPSELSFDLGSIETPEPAAEAPAAPASSGVNFDISNISTPSASAADQSDPLVQSFPELLEVNEITLNFELAAQYIQLGAYQSASDILDEKEADYSPEQREQAQLLRNQIAS